jgi:hypothetical protein
MAEKTAEKTDEELSLLTFADKCMTREQWLRVVRRGLPTLLKNPGLLLEIIMREALQEDGREDMNARTREIFPEAQQILKDLGLKFSLED